MGRKNYSPAFKVIDQGDISGNLVSKVSTVDLQDRVLYDVEWAGAGGVLGDFEVQISDDKNDDSSWVALDFSQPLQLTTDTGSHQILITDLTCKYIRFVYTFSAGTGAITVTYRATSQGA